ncbi:hypothetical protein LDENG_00020600 [Lucifuga dentata]|nr:hypothetical protein LDENG_00020600 [Lucifuga dentata]
MEVETAEISEVLDHTAGGVLTDTKLTKDLQKPGDSDQITHKPKRRWQCIPKYVFIFICVGVIIILTVLVGAMAVLNLDMKVEQYQLSSENNRLKMILRNESLEKCLLLNVTLEDLMLENRHLNVLLKHALSENNISKEEIKELGLLLSACSHKECSHQKLQLNACLQNISLLAKEKTQLLAANRQLNILLNSTPQLQQQNLQLNIQLNNSQQKLMQSERAVEEQKQQNLQLNMQLQNSLQKFKQSEHLEEECRQKNLQLSQQLSTLNQSYSELKQLASLQNMSTQCANCPYGWFHHASQCYFMSLRVRNWTEARHHCQKLGGDMVVIRNIIDQMFITNFTSQYKWQYPGERILSVWIGLQDMKVENEFVWINNEKLNPNETYWKKGEPNNALIESQYGQDCVVVVASKETIPYTDWTNSWDDLNCDNRTRHYMCERAPINT